MKLALLLLRLVVAGIAPVLRAAMMVVQSAEELKVAARDVAKALLSSRITSAN